jgi:hypothetical protein
VITKKHRTFASAFEKQTSDGPIKDALVAQLVEHLTLNQRVQGSTPCGRTLGENLGSLFFFVLAGKYMKNDEIGMMPMEVLSIKKAIGNIWFEIAFFIL